MGRRAGLLRTALAAVIVTLSGGVRGLSAQEQNRTLNSALQAY